VFLAAQGVGRLRPVLRAGGEHEGSDLSPSRPSGEWEPGDKLEVSRIGPWDIARIKEEGVRPIRVSQDEDGCGCRLADQDTLGLGRGIWDRSERRDVVLFDKVGGCGCGQAKLTRELREDREEHVVCSRGHCSFWGGPRWRLGV